MVPNGYSGILEPEDVYRQDSGLLVGRTACTVRNGFTLVRIVNVSEASIELHKDTPIGFFHAAVQQGVKVARVGVYELIEMAPAEKEQTKRAKCVPDVDLTKSTLGEYQKHDVQSLLSRYSDVSPRFHRSWKNKYRETYHYYWRAPTSKGKAYRRVTRQF